MSYADRELAERLGHKGQWDSLLRMGNHHDFVDYTLVVIAAVRERDAEEREALEGLAVAARGIALGVDNPVQTMGGFLMTSGECRCPECHHPIPREQKHHAENCKLGTALARLDAARKSLAAPEPEEGG